MTIIINIIINDIVKWFVLQLSECFPTVDYKIQSVITLKLQAAALVVFLFLEVKIYSLETWNKNKK